MPTIPSKNSQLVSCLSTQKVTHLQPAGDRLAEDDLADAVRAAFARPIGYPPLIEATVADDDVVLAIGAHVPRPVEMIEGALAALDDAGVALERIGLLLPNTLDRSSKVGERLSARDKINAQVTWHDPEDLEEIAMLGVTKAGRALRLSRRLCEADVVVSIGMGPADGKNGAAGGLFPGFSDRETIDRYYAPISTDSDVIGAERQAEMEESHRMLGLGLTVQVVPGISGGVAALSAGDPVVAAREAAEKYREIWSRGCESRGDLVVAIVAAGDSQQTTWQDVGRALDSARRVVEPDGAIVVWSTLADRPGQSLSRLLDSGDLATVERELMRDRSSDSRAAVQLCRALQEGTVYLHSHLKTTLVESLGMAPIDDLDELRRLSRSHRHGIVLDEAQHLLPYVIGEEGP